MARTYWDGFDAYAAAADMNSQFAANYIGGSFPAGRFTPGRCYLMDTGQTGNVGLGRNVSTGTDRQSFGAAFQTHGTNRPSMFGGGFFTSNALPSNARSTGQMSYAINSAGAILVYRGTTLIWQSLDNVIVDGSWNFIGFSALLHATAGSWSLSINGFQLVQQTNVNTMGIPGDPNIRYCFPFACGNIAGPPDVSIDDFYTDDAYLATVPERRVETLYPSADGGTLNLIPSSGTSHYPLVGESQLNTATYLSGSAVGDLDEFSLTDLVNIPTTIDGIKVAGYASKTDAATRAVNYGARSNGVDALGADLPLNPTALQQFNNVLLNPDGNVPWTAASVNALKSVIRIAV